MSHFKLGCALLVLSACGDVKGNTIDAAMHDTPPADAAVDADTRACDPSKPFGQPKNIMELNTAGADAYIYLSADELTAYVTNNIGPSPQGGYDLYVTTRASITSTFGTLSPLASLNTSADQEAPALSTDGLTIYYYDSSTGGGDIFAATRSSVSANFGTGSSLAIINSTTAYDHCPYPSADGLTMYFCSTRNAVSSVKYDIFMATRASTSGPFSTPTAVSELNTTQFAESNAVLTPDGKIVYWCSDRTGTTGLLDIWRATRATTTDPFGSITNVAEINSAVDEWPSYVSADDCRLYFSGDRGGGSGSHDLWLAVRPK